MPQQVEIWLMSTQNGASRTVLDEEATPAVGRTREASIGPKNQTRLTHVVAVEEEAPEVLKI
jgi:hypothetical protein